MSQIIKNFSALATSQQRRDALTIVEAGLQAIDTSTVLQDSIAIEGDILTIQGRQFDLTEYEHIYIIGFGKVACTAAYTLEQIFAGRVREGAVIGITERVCQVVDTYAGTHPLPSQQNFTATKHIEEVARCAKKDDLVLVIVSGGGSALLCSSMSECEQGTRLFASFLQSGGTIEELNTVRKHISHLKGGGLAKSLYPATVVGLVFSDVPGGDMAAVASGPTCFDSSTVHEAEALIEKYNLGSFRLLETPKDPKYFQRVHNFTIVSNVTALTAIQKTAADLSYRADLVSATAYSTAQETKELLQEKSADGFVCCMGGETKVLLPEECVGEGGRNSYLALTMLETLSPNQVFISIASDGRDNTDVAGAIADIEVLQRARQLDLSVEEHLAIFDSYPFFAQVGAHVHTGPLESNVSDLMILLTPHKEIAQTAITDVTAQVIKDSRGTPTLSVTVMAGEHAGTFSVPGGASTGEHEVSVLSAAQAVKILDTVVKPAIVGLDVTNQSAIDTLLHNLDNTERFSYIGGNLALGVSVAACKCSAAVKGVEPWQRVAELFEYKEQSIAPRVFVNLINGGKHAKAGSPIQEHQIIPDTHNVHEALRAVKLVQTALRDVLGEHYSPQQITIGDEGGFVVPSTTIFEPFTYIKQAIERADTDISLLIGSDIAASSFYTDGSYHLPKGSYAPEELLGIYDTLHTEFPMLQMVEDPYDEHDFSGFAAYHEAHPGVLTIGDDLTTTNKTRLQQAITQNAINALIIKPNQIGTLSDTLETMSLAYENKVWCIVSHRSGETEDDFIADLAFGTKCYGLKAGAPSMPERAAKYNRLLRIQPK
jgi:phosphopyruvate hydratase